MVVFLVPLYSIVFYTFMFEIPHIKFRLFLNILMLAKEFTLKKKLQGFNNHYFLKICYLSFYFYVQFIENNFNVSI